MSLIENLPLYFHTLRHLRPVQFYGRLWFRVARPKMDISAAPARRPCSEKWIRPARRRPSLTRAEAFVFLNEAATLADIGWDGPEREKLWRYNQHYFDDLNAHDNEARSEWHRRLLDTWVLNNPPADGVGWDPYPTSLRIVNWIKWALGGNILSDAHHDSLAIQARWLMQRLEWHLLGNHLFSNAKALIFAGLYFQGPEAERWLRKGFDILKREIPEQILSDGGHFERSTMYHALALEDMLDLSNVFRLYGGSLNTTQQDLADGLPPRIDDMLAWLSIMCHPDGEISFFNDAAFGIAPVTNELFSYAMRLDFDAPDTHEEITRLPDSGYLRLQTYHAVSIIDMAPIGPDYLPGHAHADTLSFELSLAGSRVFVNSGTSVYGRGAERHRQRGTSAHNTVTINGENSSEVWSGFRVARRAHPAGAQIAHDTDIEVTCAHDGYTRLRDGGRHTRRWSLNATGIKVEDVVTTQTYTADARFHVHPDIDVRIADDGISGTLHLPTGMKVRWQSNGGKPRLESTTWHPEFGISVPTTCLVLPLDEGRCDLTLSWA